MLAASSPGTYRLISLWLLPSPNRDSAVGPRIAWCSGRISACAIGMIAEGRAQPAERLRKAAQISRVATAKIVASTTPRSSWVI
jgi:hypothetical protein